jgi:hypothetical protein
MGMLIREILYSYVRIMYSREADSVKAKCLIVGRAGKSMDEFICTPREK